MNYRIPVQMLPNASIDANTYSFHDSANLAVTELKLQGKSYANNSASLFTKTEFSG